MPYVVSTLANSQAYAEYETFEASGSQMARPAVSKRKVLIQGGAHVQGALRTPEGVLTRVSDEEVEFLKTIPLFIQHEKGGHIKIVNREVNPDKVAQDLKVDNGDTQHGERVSGGSSQLSIAGGDFEAGGRASGPEPLKQEII